MSWTNTHSSNSYSSESPLISDPIQYSNFLQFAAFSESGSASPQTVAFIDSTIPDVTKVLAETQSDVRVLLDPTQDGVAQITETLEHYQDLTSIVIISHGNVAKLQLGNSFLSADSLDQYADELQQWGVSLAPEADILLYSCDVAEGEDGQDFVQDLSTLTDADIAASNNSTGNQSQGGDWTLEYTTGGIEAPTPFSSSLMSTYEGVLDSFFASTTSPATPDATDGTAYELGLEFTSAQAGQIQAVRYWKSPSETGTHVGKIWSSTGTLLASITFTNETASGWQQQALSTPLNIQANTTYVVSVNANTHFGISYDQFATPVTNGSLSTVADGSNGVFGTPDALPTQSYRNSNYYRDIVFAVGSSGTNNPGTVTLSDTTPSEDQTLTATVSDTDGLTGATVSYQWQQSSNNGTTWSNITGATSQTFTLGDKQVGELVRVRANYTDTLGNGETVFSAATEAVSNVNDLGLTILRGSATTGHALTASVVDADGLAGTINYQWQQFLNETWTNIAGAIGQTLTLGTSLLDRQVRATVAYIDAFNTSENVFSAGTIVAAQNPIVLENQQLGTTNWQITNRATNNEISGYASETSVDQGEFLPIKVSLNQSGQYRIDVYRLGYYGGAGGRLITTSGVLNGVNQGGAAPDPNTRLVEYDWNTSYNLLVGSDWTSGLYTAKLTELSSGKESEVWFAVRDDDRPTDIGFQSSFTTYQAYNKYGGYSTYEFNSNNQQRAYQVSFDRPFSQTVYDESGEWNSMLRWEYNKVRWLESQGYDISYYTNLDVHENPLQLYSQNVFLSVGHDEYWSMEMRDNVEQARDNGINLAFFSANTAYWRVRFEPSSTGEPNRVMTVYKNDWALDPVAQQDPSAATTLFRSPQVNRPENALLGVMYIGDRDVLYGGYDFVVTNSSDPYYANTGLQNGDVLPGLVGYEWDAVVNNGFTPTGLVTLSQSPVSPQNIAPQLPAGTNTTISNAVRYTAASGAKVFSTGSVQWAWGLDSEGVTNPRTDIRAQQIAVNIFGDMGAKPQTPSSGIVVT